MLCEQIGTSKKEVLEFEGRQIDQVKLGVLLAPFDAAGMREDFGVENVHFIVLVHQVDLLLDGLEHRVLDAAIVI